MDITEAIKLAREDADTAIAMARGHFWVTMADPIVWLTSNSYMPPLRGFGSAEMVWKADDTGELWEAYVEAFEQALEDANVYLGSPDYDNSLYVVDLRRWRYRDDADDVETLTYEWEPIR